MSLKKTKETIYKKDHTKNFQVLRNLFYINLNTSDNQALISDLAKEFWLILV